MWGWWLWRWRRCDKHCGVGVVPRMAPYTLTLTSTLVHIYTYTSTLYSFTLVTLNSTCISYNNRVVPWSMLCDCRWVFGFQLCWDLWKIGNLHWIFSKAEWCCGYRVLIWANLCWQWKSDRGSNVVFSSCNGYGNNSPYSNIPCQNQSAIVLPKDLTFHIKMKPNDMCHHEMISRKVGALRRKCTTNKFIIALTKFLPLILITSVDWCGPQTRKYAHWIHINNMLVM